MCQYGVFDSSTCHLSRPTESSQIDGGNEDTRTAESSQNDGGNEDTRTAESSQNDGGNEDILSQKVYGKLAYVLYCMILYMYYIV